MLRESGFKVTLVCSPGVLLEETAARDGVERIALPIKRQIAPCADLISLARLWMILRRLSPEVTEFSTPKAGLLGSVAAWLSRVPVRVYLLRGLKLETCTGLKRRILLAAERVASACSHQVLCNSESLRRQVIAERAAPKAKLRLLGDGSSKGVDTEHFSPGTSDAREKLGIPMNAKVIGFVGRLTRDKGVPDLVEAFDRILAAEPGVHLILVGWFDKAEDALGSDLRSRIEANPSVHYTGFVKDTAPYYRAMDLLVLPSWREGFPNVVLEAGACGIPVVATISTGSRDAVVPEVTGLLIPPGYPEAIFEAVMTLLGSPQRRLRMGSAAREWVIEHFSNERVMGLASEFYRELLAGATVAKGTGILGRLAGINGE